jgi:hypothetical protein
VETLFSLATESLSVYFSAFGCFGERCGLCLKRRRHARLKATQLRFIEHGELAKRFPFFAHKCAQASGLFRPQFSRQFRVHFLVEIDKALGYWDAIRGM